MATRQRVTTASISSSSSVGMACSRLSSRTVRPSRAAAFLKVSSSPVGTTTEVAFWSARKVEIASATSDSLETTTTFAE